MPSVDHVGADAAPWGGETCRDVEGLDGSASARTYAVLQPMSSSNAEVLRQMRHLRQVRNLRQMRHVRGCVRCANRYCVRCAI